MHEWHLAAEIVGKVRNACSKDGASRIKEVKISLGDGLGITSEEFRFCLAAAVKDKPEFSECNFKIDIVKSALASIDEILAE